LLKNYGGQVEPIRVGRTWSDPIQKIRPIRQIRIRSDPIFKKNQTNSTRPDPRTNYLQSNRNLLKIWKNTTCKLTRPDFFQKVKLTRPKPVPIATSKPNWMSVLKLESCYNFYVGSSSGGPVRISLIFWKKSGRFRSGSS
jgi:hypothetical protein